MKMRRHRASWVVVVSVLALAGSNTPISAGAEASTADEIATSTIPRPRREESAAAEAATEAAVAPSSVASMRRRDASVTERDLLMRFYNETLGDQWLKSTGWGSDEDYCEWFGITCAATTSSTSSSTASHSPRVVEIQLPKNNVARSIAVLWTLPRLRRVNVQRNPINDLGLLSNSIDSLDLVLEALDAEDCLLSSTDGLERAASTLEELRLAGNLGLANLNPNPVESLLSRLPRLEILDLSSCSLQGTLPSAWNESAAFALRELRLSNNRIQGSIPTTIDQLRNLQVLDLSSSLLTGSMPTQLENLAHLQALYLQSQQNPEGSVAGSATSRPAGLSGPLLAFASTPYLSTLVLSKNQFTGTLPDNLLESYRPLSSINQDDVHDDASSTNRDDDAEKEQVTIDVSYNNLNGTLPESFGERFDRLHLNIVGNLLEGPIPDSYCLQDSWMDGGVATLGCEAIACPIGFYAPGVGRAAEDPTDPSTCEECSDNAKYVGATTCGEDEPLTEPEILLELYNATGGSDGSWVKSDGWDGLVELAQSVYNQSSSNSSSACRLYGIRCNSLGQVTIIALSNNGLVGTLPSSLFQLPNLASLDMSDNFIEVERWTGLERAASLTRLKMSRTRITSLRHISQATQLTELAADGNHLDGPIPADLFELTNLVDLRLEASFLTGTIPSELSQLTKLKKLHLNENQLNSELPSDFAQLSLLEELDLSNLQLNGTLPDEWNSLQRLITLRINGDQREGGLVGPLIPFSGLERIETFEMAYNDLEGPIPDSFLAGRSRSGSLRIDFRHNRLRGSIPTTLGTLERLFLDLSDNQISGLSEELCQDEDWMDGQIALVPDSCDAILCPPGTWSDLGRASSKADVWCNPCANSTFFGSTTCSSKEEKPNQEAEILDLLYISTGGPWWRKPHYNWTKPNIPLCHREGVRCAGGDPNSGVVEIYLNEFGMRGKIPDEIFELPQLRLLGVSFNNVDLSLKNIGKARKLQSLLASATNVQSLSGIENAGDGLAEIHLAKNGIKGTFPSEILYLDSLRDVYLNENKFSGTIPAEVSHMKALRKLMLEENRFVGYLPSQLGLLSDLTNFNVQGNVMSGLIPQAFSKLEKLVDVNLSNQKSVKKFTGPVSSFEANPALARIDLSGNSFAGALPPSFLSSVDKTIPIYANLSRNSLHGAIPESFDQFQKLDLDLSSNLISFMPTILCDNSDWMSGMVGNVHPDEACNAILCPPGTFAPYGRQLHANAPCVECPGKEEAPYYGSTGCDDTPVAAPCLVEVVNGSAACSDDLTERSILELLFASTWGGGWTNKTGWMTDQPICSWEGVICVGDASDDSGVLAINLRNNGLKGEIPAELWTLADLRHVAVSSNPDLVVSLRDVPASAKVESLILHETQVRGLDALPTALPIREISFSGLTGAFPVQLLKLRNLETLNMDENHFAGTLPTDWSKAKRLKILSARGNDFHGSVPSSLLRIKTLEELALDDNLLSGELPLDAISSSASFRAISIGRYQKASGPKLSGRLPSFLSARELETVSFHGNDLTGSIPLDFIAAASSRNVLLVDLRNNQLIGTIPSGLINLPSNPDLQIVGNHFDTNPATSCDINDLGNATSSNGMGTCSNMLLCPPGTWNSTGSPFNSSFDTCSKCPSNETAAYYGSTSCESVLDDRSVLVELFNSCGGPAWYRRDFWMSPAHACDWHGVGCSTQGDVILLNLQNNNLQCEIPAAVFQLPHLEKLDVSSNPITVNFQKLSPSQRPRISELRLSNTYVSSLVGVEALDGLTVLDASYSKITGPFPDRAVANLPNLRALLLSGNDLNGPLVESASAEGSTFFTSEDRHRPSLLRVLKLDGNKLSGSVPSLGGIETLRHLSLSHNRFNGSLPIELLSHVSVTTAEGPEPSSHLAMLTIDLSDNALTGMVPEELSRFENASVRLLLAGNRIESVPVTLCKMSPLWNDGDLTRFGCDGLLCPMGTYHATGRSTLGYGACQPCPKSSKSSKSPSSHEAAYLGQRSCPGTAAVSSSAPSGRHVLWSIAASTIALTILAITGFGAA